MLVVGAAVAAPMEELEYDVDCQDGEKFGDEEFCDKFHVCVDNGLSFDTNDCPDGLVFDEDSEQCDFPQRVDCGPRNLLQEPKPSPGCPRMNGKFGVPGSCKDYFDCFNGQGTAVRCAPSLVFNQNGTQCDWMANLAKDSECTPELLAIEEGRQDCPENLSPYQYARWEHETDCDKFWLCIDGNDRISGCPDGLVYNPETYSCEDQENVQGACSEFYSENELEYLRNKKLN